MSAPRSAAAEAGPVAVFAYGSLVAPESLARTLGRPLRDAGADLERRPATLRGWRRRWSLVRDNLTCEKTFARDGDGSVPEQILSLNVERTGERTDVVNGVLVALTEAELARLDLRELRYDRLEATADLSPDAARDAFVSIHAYTAKAANFAPVPPPGAVILRSYATAVRDAFAQLGAEQLGLYLQTTGQPPAELVDAHLLRGRIPPGNPRSW